jgi:hypothetical protein
MSAHKQSQFDYLYSKISNQFSYARYLNSLTPISRRKIRAQASYFQGYPENHNYFYLHRQLVPSLKLYERFKKISELYPPNMQSLLDLSTCRGFYVLEASFREHMVSAVGIDLVESFIQECNAIKMYTHADKANFYVSSLEDIYRKTTEANTPFETVIFTGSYHYFYWGSAQNPAAYMDHDKILAMLAGITSGRVIFSGRLELAQLAAYPKEVALNHPQRDLYTTAEFLRCASKYFKASHAGYLGKDSLILLEKRS